MHNLIRVATDIFCLICMNSRLIHLRKKQKFHKFEVENPILSRHRWRLNETFQTSCHEEMWVFNTNFSNFYSTLSETMSRRIVSISGSSLSHVWVNENFVVDEFSEWIFSCLGIERRWCCWIFQCNLWFQLRNTEQIRLTVISEDFLVRLESILLEPIVNSLQVCEIFLV